MWTQLPPENRHTHHPTQFLAHVYCSQMAGWIKTPLGTEVDLGPGHIYQTGSQLFAKGAQLPIFGPCRLWSNGWMGKDATWYGSRPRPRPHCVRRGPSSPARKALAASLFSAHVYCGPMVTISATAELLLAMCITYDDIDRGTLPSNGLNARG